MTGADYLEELKLNLVDLNTELDALYAQLDEADSDDGDCDDIMVADIKDRIDTVLDEIAALVIIAQMENTKVHAFAGED